MAADPGSVLIDLVRVETRLYNAVDARLKDAGGLTLPQLELLTAIRIPSTWAGARFYFEKVRDRNVWDFPLLNVASAARFAAGKIDQIRIVINAAAATPLRLHAVEAAVVGKPRNEQTAELAGQIAIEGAQALRYNGYKIPLMRNLVKRAIRGNGSDT